MKYKLAYRLGNNEPQVLSFSSENGRDIFKQKIEQDDEAHVIEEWIGPNRELNMPYIKYTHITEDTVLDIMRRAVEYDAIRSWACLDNTTKEYFKVRDYLKQHPYKYFKDSYLYPTYVFSEMVWMDQPIVLLPRFEEDGPFKPLNKHMLIQGILKFVETFPKRDIDTLVDEDVDFILQCALFGGLLYA